MAVSGYIQDPANQGYYYSGSPYVNNQGGGGSPMNSAIINSMPANFAGHAVGHGAGSGGASFGEKASATGRGIFKGIGNMVKSVFTPKGLLMAAGAIALTVATGGAATPFLIAAGAAMGTVQAAKGGVQLASGWASGDLQQIENGAAGFTEGAVGVAASAAGARARLGGNASSKGFRTALKNKGSDGTVSTLRSEVANQARDVLKVGGEARSSIGEMRAVGLRGMRDNLADFANNTGLRNSGGKRYKDISTELDDLNAQSIEVGNDPSLSHSQKLAKLDDITQSGIKLMDEQNQLLIDNPNSRFARNHRVNNMTQADRQAEMANLKTKIDDGSATYTERADYRAMQQTELRTMDQADFDAHIQDLNTQAKAARGGQRRILEGEIKRAKSIRKIGDFESMQATVKPMDDATFDAHIQGLEARAQAPGLPKADRNALNAEIKLAQQARSGKGPRSSGLLDGYGNAVADSHAVNPGMMWAIPSLMNNTPNPFTLLGSMQGQAGH